MRKPASLVSIAGGAAGAIAALRRAVGGASQSDPDADPWHAVTVNRAPGDLPADVLPVPLAAFGDTIEVVMRPAPGDRGTEIHARPLNGADAEAHRRLRRALRESRSLLELGEVIEPNANVTTEPTALNRPIRAATARGKEEGLL